MEKNGNSRKSPGKNLQETVSAAQYIAIKDSVNAEKQKLQNAFIAATSEVEKLAIIKKAEILFTDALLNNIINAWYGTPWDFYGTTEVPNDGYIACGYFVTTVLRDASVKLDRIHLAEIASETMIRTVIDKKYINRYRNKHYTDFIKAVKTAGDALYMIGLDYHTGFVLCKNGQVYFIHSTIPGVMKEVGEQSYMLCQSNYRVTGRLTNNPEFMKKWLLGEEFKN
ncbi:MAG: hypothetical protein EOP53_23485, partial [Sphingobacteriales bacterium]